MKLWIQLVLLTILDFILIWLYVEWEDPEASSSIGILLVVPLAIMVNLVVGCMFHLVRRRYARAFLINSVIAAVIMYYFFIAGIERHQRLRYEGWSCRISDTTFWITHSKLDSTFRITYSLQPGSSWSFIDGKFIIKDGYYLLVTDTSKFMIKDNLLVGFRGTGGIKLTEVGH